MSPFFTVFFTEERPLLESGDLPSAGGGLRAAMGFMATTKSNSPQTTNSPGIPWPSLARLLEISMRRETTKLYDKMSINIMNICILTILYILNDS